MGWCEGAGASLVATVTLFRRVAALAVLFLLGILAAGWTFLDALDAGSLWAIPIGGAVIFYVVALGMILFSAISRPGDWMEASKKRRNEKRDHGQRSERRNP